MTSALEAPSPPPRGVYLSHIKARDGSLVMYAVDSQGRSIGKRVLRGEMTPERAELELQELLSRVDPISRPQLLLIKPERERLSPSTFLALCGALVPRVTRPSSSRSS